MSPDEPAARHENTTLGHAPRNTRFRKLSLNVQDGPTCHRPMERVTYLSHSTMNSSYNTMNSSYNTMKKIIQCPNTSK
jgi:hypothetical protein